MLYYYIILTIIHPSFLVKLYYYPIDIFPSGWDLFIIISPFYLSLIEWKVSNMRFDMHLDVNELLILNHWNIYGNTEAYAMQSIIMSTQKKWMIRMSCKITIKSYVTIG